MSEEHEVSGSGQPVHRHQERDRAFEIPVGDPGSIEKIERHIEAHLGKIDSVFHEWVSDLVHLDVHFIKPTAGRDFYTLVTSGMSDRPMTVPEGAEDFRYAELMISLPPDWAVGSKPFKDERNYWPVRLLKQLARLPHEYETWLGWGHTIPNGNPPVTYAANTGLCCALLLAPETTPGAFDRLEIGPNKVINFYALFPLHREEMDLKLERGTQALLSLLAEEGVTEILDVNRRNVAR